MKRRRDDTKELDVLTEWLPGLGYSSSGCTVVRPTSSYSAPITIDVADRKARKRLLDHWTVARYNETACCPGKYCEHAIADIVDRTGRSEETIRNTIRRYRRGGLTARSS